MLRSLLALGGPLIAGLLLLATLALAYRARRRSSVHVFLALALGLSCVGPSQQAWVVCALVVEAFATGAPSIALSKAAQWGGTSWLWVPVLLCWTVALGLSVSGRWLLVPSAREVPWTTRIRGVVVAGALLIGMSALDEHLQSTVLAERIRMNDRTSFIEYRAESEPEPVVALANMAVRRLTLETSGEVVALAVDAEGGVWRWRPWSVDVNPLVFPAPVSTAGLLGTAVCGLGVDGFGACGGHGGDPGASHVPPSAWRPLGDEKVAAAETFSGCGSDRGARVCALSESGRGRCWHADAGLGLSEDEPLGDDLVAITTAFGCAGCGAHRDGTTRCFRGLPQGGRSTATVRGLRGAVLLASDIDVGCAIDADRSLVCWGVDWFAGEDRGGAPRELEGRRLLEGTRVDHVAVGPSHACAVATSGEVFCWGHNDWGQLGSGGTADSAEPVRVVGIEDASRVAVAGAMTCVVRGGGAVSCWGMRPRFRD